MEGFSTLSNKLKILVVNDVNSDSVNALAEKFAPHDATIDLIICCGPFSQTENWNNSKEDHAIAQGDMASLLSSLEQIQCRVVYLPAGTDPPSSFISQLHLTPNSINIHARKMNLRDELYISGFTETYDNLAYIDNIDNIDDDKLEGVEVKSGTSSIQIIEEIIQNSVSKDTDTDDNDHQQQQQQPYQNGIFLLNYRFTHTLNHFLFHMSEQLEAANISICIIPQNNDKLKLPDKFGKLSIISPPSLREEHKYTILELSLNDNIWTLDKAEIYHL